MFRITGAKGFQMTFENGWTISVQWGMGNYCENRSRDLSGGWLEREREAAEKGSIDAEVAAWDANGEWYNFGGDEVAGWKSTNEVANFIANIASLPAALPESEDVPLIPAET